ncbi:hypothetical protein F2Q68_00002764 [Brassica cretica]|uniref:Brf1 TBP-binding domain-containing protein n=1 Tax=Brassica cretica TaxID=69181 RepID=A0A8S9J7A0_BRACR|nr:hypothetical protein F2Q68_00002764 [Brassica cretica]
MREPLYSNVSKKVKPCLKKGEGEKDEDDSEVSDESGNFSDVRASSSNLPEHARKLVEASKAAVAKSRKEKQQKRAEEEKNAPPPATTTESVRRMLDRKVIMSLPFRTNLELKRLRGLIPDDLLDELFDTSPRFQEEGYVESYDINTDLPDCEKLYEEEDEEEEEDEHSSKSGVSYGSQWFAREEKRWNEPSSLRKKGLVVLPGEDALPPDVASKLFDPLLRASAANGNTTEKKGEAEKQQKRAEEEKNAPPPATATEAVRRMLDKKRLSGLINYDLLDELFDTSPTEKPAKISRTETVMEKTKEEKKEVKSNKLEDGENEEEDQEDYVESFDINTDFPDGENLYAEENEEEEEDGYDFGLY